MVCSCYSLLVLGAVGKIPVLVSCSVCVCVRGGEGLNICTYVCGSCVCAHATDCEC